MRTLIQSLLAVSLVCLGYLLGASGMLAPGDLRAQEEESGPSDEAIDQIKTATEALGAAMATLQQEDLYEPVIDGLNAFAVTVGGLNAREDLENGRGVDPETFAALYADQAIDEVKVYLKYDDDGRLTYKNKLVRMYPISRLKRLYAARAKLAGEEFPTDK